MAQTIRFLNDIYYSALNSTGATANTSLCLQTSTGRVGIGTTNPGYLLDLCNGDIRTQNGGNVGGVGGAINFGANAGYGPMAQIKGALETAAGSVNDQGSVVFLTRPLESSPYTVRTNLTERMRITSGGNVGIGLTNPQSTLHVYKNGNYPEVFVDYGTGGQIISLSTGTSGAALGYSGYLVIGTITGAQQAGFSEKVRITAAGNVGIGLTGPSYQLDLSTDGARKLTTTTWLTGSDQRIKTDIQSANLQMCYDTVKSIDLKYFKWNFPTESNVVPDDKHSLGFIAQEVRSVFPNAVSESNSYGFTDFLSLNTDQILKAMYGALQKTMADKESLEQRLAALEQSLATATANNSSLESKLAA